MLCTLGAQIEGIGTNILTINGVKSLWGGEHTIGPDYLEVGSMIGLAAATGTPVQAVQAGRVVLAGPYEGYGPTVVLSHGDGFYTLYLYLEDIGVVEGRDVVVGQVVGTVGGADTPEGPHLEFQIRAPLDSDSPTAQDPLRWLRPRDGA